MRIEVLGAFGEQQEDGSSVCFHPPGVPYPDGSKPKRFLETGLDLRIETAEWAIKLGAAKPVYTAAATPQAAPAIEEEVIQDEEPAPVKKGKKTKTEESEP